MLDRKKNIIAEWLASEGYAEVEPMDFYRELFPQGLIDNSVLVAFGEISTFAGALFGVDYTYKFKIKNNE